MNEELTYKKIGSICDVKTGKLDANASDENGIYPFFTCSKEPLRINTYSYDAECVLIAGNGDLNVKYYNGKFDAYQRTYILTIKNGVTDVSMQYLYLFFQLYVETLRKNSIGGVIKYIKLGDITEANIPVPPLPTQSRIVSELDLLQSIIDKQKAQLKDLDNLAQVLFYDMFGDPVENEKGWEVKKFGEVASFKNGLNFSPNENGEMYYIIGVSDFQAKSEINCNENLTIIHLNDAINKEYLLQNDDILFVRSNGNKQLIARNILVKTNNLNVTFSGFCIRARITRNDVSAFFINSLLKLPTSHEALTLKGRGCNISNLNQTTLNDYEIILPPLPLQQSFAQKVESIERQKELINQSIREAQTLFDSRMEYYFGE